LTRNVPCIQRVREFEKSVKNSESQIVLEEDGGWVLGAASHDEKEEIPEIEDEGARKKAMSDDDDDIPDMEDFQEEAVDYDTAKIEESDNVLKTRTYDLSITYDKYYQTPKVWLYGYDENRRPLKPDEVFQDISQDHAHKTVTIDIHPFLGYQCAFIHPCRHSAVMKKIVDHAIDSGRELRVDQYLFIFLKFISSVIPTIEYDFTMEMDSF